MSNTVPVVKAIPEGGGSVQVTAPLDLQEGYQLQVSVNGDTKSVTVPSGGVKEGQSFTAYVDEQHVGGIVVDGSSKVHNIPSSKWRDGLCDCCTNGICHAMCWFGWCCTPIVLGQVATRMSRNFLGNPGQRPSVSNTCMIITAIFFGWIILQAIFEGIVNGVSCWGVKEEWNDAGDELVWTCPDGTTVETNTTMEVISALIGIFAFAWCIYIICAVCNTRRSIREKYDIPTGCCGGCEDCCCAFWCMCCAVEQMARHTNDYEENDVGCCSAECCNKRGQPLNVPEIV